MALDPIRPRGLAEPWRRGFSLGQSLPPQEMASFKKQALWPSDKPGSELVPPSRLYESLRIDPFVTYRLPPLDAQETQRENGRKHGLRIGVVRPLPVPLDVLSHSKLYVFPLGHVGIMEVISEGALWVRVHFVDVDLPPGAKLYVYSNASPDDLYGPYEGRGPFNNGTFWTPPVEGEGAIIEYFSPSADFLSESGTPPFRISEISHTFKDPLDPGSDAGVQVASCHPNVPSSWANTAKAVGGLDFISGPDVIWCTGTLLAEKSGDFTPYFLTANHCLSKESDAQTVRIWWFYDGAGQLLSSKPHSDVTTILATRNAIVGTDFTVLMVLGKLPISSGMVFAGWTRAMPGLFTAVVGIHHPDGSYKRIAFGDIATKLWCPSSDINCNNFLGANWDVGKGGTEGGSSGSGLWLDNSTDPKLVGQLWGFSVTNDPCAILLDEHSWYGRFDLTYAAISNFLAGGSDDSLEPNDSRASAKVIESGSRSDLVVKLYGEDWYKVSVPSGNKISVNISFKHDYGDIDLELYRGSDATPVDSSGGIGNSESVEHVNTGSSADYFVRVYLIDNTRNSYDMTVSVQVVDTTPPTPNPMTWATEPYETSTTAISMTATTASDSSTPIQYYFNFYSGGSGGNDSGWQSSTSYTDSGLSPNTEYCYRVKARDGSSNLNETSYSSVSCDHTAIQTPTGISFGTMTDSSIALTATGTLSNLTAGSSGVYFDSTTTGGDGGINEWVKITSDTATGLSPNTQYTFQVKARNGDGAETGYSPSSSKYTLAKTPSAPTVSNPTSTTLDVDVNPNGNPSATQFAIYNDTAAYYVNASGGSNGSTPVWQTDAQWGNIKVTGLTPNTTYNFKVKARNADNNETTLGPLGSGTTKAQFTLKVIKAGSDDGTVTSSPAGISCGSDCSETYTHGTAVTLTASPATGASFGGWSGGGCTGTGTCKVTMSANTTVTAKFSKLFTDDPLTAQVTPAKALHVTELRAAINTLRSWVDKLPYPYPTDPTITAGVTEVKAVHLNEMCTALKEAYPAAACATNVVPGQIIQATDFTKLRAAVRALE